MAADVVGETVHGILKLSPPKSGILLVFVSEGDGEDPTAQIRFWHHAISMDVDRSALNERIAPLYIL